MPSNIFRRRNNSVQCSKKPGAKRQTPATSINSASRLTKLFLIGFCTVAIFKAAPTISMAANDECYSDIGCFPLSEEFFHPKHRPFNARPWPRRHIRTQFELFNKAHPEGYMLVPWDLYNLAQSGFNKRLETKIIIPGWLDNISRTLWVRKLKDALLWNWSPTNIIVVRWTNFTPYTIATANSRVVGAELANLLKFIEAKYNYDRAYYHIIGHSLGAHIGGYCGDRIPGLGRITALDPARPFFQHMPKSVRLDRQDAKFVDVIHSDFTPENAIFLLMSYGMTTPVGHVDFYPNGPPYFQPGCLRDTLMSVQNGIARGLENKSLSIAFLEAIRYLTACDHQRSHEWFIESVLNRECLFVGVRCNEFEGMINGRCTCDDSPSSCAIMGIHADQLYVNNLHEDVWPMSETPAASAKAKRYVAARPAAGSMKPQVNDEEIEHSLKQQLELMEFGQLTGPAAGDDYDILGMFADSKIAAADAEAPSESRDEIYAKLKASAKSIRYPTEPRAIPEDPMHNQYEKFVRLSMELQYDDPSRPMETAPFEQDYALLDYLRANLLASHPHGSNFSPTKVSRSPNQTNRHNSTTYKDAMNAAASEQQISIADRRQDYEDARLQTYVDHQRHLQMSSLDRDIEIWYEETSKWFLKTTNSAPYCTNQYQLLIYLGALRTHDGRDRLRANLVVSISGSRGQLIKQRFVPTSSSIYSHTMQPFFIILESSYTIGRIQSISVSWEARRDPDPVQATITFQSDALEQIQHQVPALKYQHPLLPDELDFDQTAAFKWPEAGWRRRADTSPKAAPVRTKKASNRSALTKRSADDAADISPVNSTSAVAHNLISRRQGDVEGDYDEESDDSEHTSASEFSSVRVMDLPPLLDMVMINPIPSVEIGLDTGDDPSEDRELANLERLRLEQLAHGGQKVARPKVAISDSSSSFLVPIVEETPEHKLVAASLQENLFGRAHDDRATGLRGLEMELNNLRLPLGHDDEDSIVIDHVLVSPLQANYGRRGRTGKIFCPARANFRLTQGHTMKLTPKLIGSCNYHTTRQTQISI